MLKSAAYSLGFKHGVKSASIDSMLGQLGAGVGSLGGKGGIGESALRLFGDPKHRRTRQSLGAAAAGVGGAGALLGLHDMFAPPENDPGVGYAQARRPMRLMAENPNIARGVMGYAY